MAKKGNHFRALDEAKAAGYRVVVRHFKDKVLFLGKYNTIPLNGWTTVIIYDDANAGGECVGSGMARCSAKDNFNRRLGVQIACGRALKQAQGR